MMHIYVLKHAKIFNLLLSDVRAVVGDKDKFGLSFSNLFFGRTIS